MTLIASGTAVWHASRATGIVSLLQLSLAMVLGVLVNQKGRLAGLPRFGVTGLHRYISLLAIVFLAVHVATAISDPTVSISVAAVFIPFASAYRPLWVGLGAVGFDLFVAVTLTSLLRLRMGHKTWRVIHWLAYAAWPIALIHGFAMGTDLRHGWEFGVAVACIVAVGVAAAWRLTTAMRGVPRWRRIHVVMLRTHHGHQDSPAAPKEPTGAKVPPPAGAHRARRPLERRRLSVPIRRDLARRPAGRLAGRPAGRPAARPGGGGGTAVPARARCSTRQQGLEMT